MILLASLLGAMITGGIVLLLRGLFGRAPAPGTPPRRTRNFSLSGANSRHALFAVAAAVLMYLVTRWPVAALAAGAAGFFLPRLSMTGAQRQRTARLEGLEQWIRRLADMVTASRGLEDALEASARSAPAAVAGPVRRLAAGITTRTGTETALRAFAAEIDDPAGDRIAAALIIATGRRGGAAREVLMALATLLGRDVAARREIEAERAQHRTTVKWIGIFIVGFTLLAILNRSYSAPFGTPAGQFMIALVSVMYGGGLYWLHRLGMLPEPGRFLDDSAASRAAGQPHPPQLITGASPEPGRSR